MQKYARAAPSRYRRSATPSTATGCDPSTRVSAPTENAPDVRAVASSSAGRSDPSWPFSNSSAKRETSSSNARLATSCTVTNTSLTTEHGKMLGTASLTLSASWEPAVARRSGLDRRTIQRAVRKHPDPTTPHRANQTRITIAAAAEARERLAELGEAPPDGALPALVRYLEALNAP